MIRAIFFDLDGVLVDAREWHYDALNRALSLFGYKISKYDHLHTYDGLPTSEKLLRLNLEAGFPKALHPFVNEMKQQYTKDLILLHCKPSFTHEYALSRLKRDGYSLAVCSNAIRDSVQLMLDKSDLTKHLDFYLSNDDVEKAKPNPEIYTKASDMMNVSSGECLVVEDNEHGVRSAEDAGCHLFRIAFPYEMTYDRIIKRIHEIDAKE